MLDNQSKLLMEKSIRNAQGSSALPTSNIVKLEGVAQVYADLTREGVESDEVGIDTSRIVHAVKTINADEVYWDISYRSGQFGESISSKRIKKSCCKKPDCACKDKQLLPELKSEVCLGGKVYDKAGRDMRGYFVESKGKVSRIGSREGLISAVMGEGKSINESDDTVREIDDKFFEPAGASSRQAENIISIQLGESLKSCSFDRSTRALFVTLNHVRVDEANRSFTELFDNLSKIGWSVTMNEEFRWTAKRTISESDARKRAFRSGIPYPTAHFMAQSTDAVLQVGIGQDGKGSPETPDSMPDAGSNVKDILLGKGEKTSEQEDKPNAVLGKSIKDILSAKNEALEPFDPSEEIKNLNKNSDLMDIIKAAVGSDVKETNESLIKIIEMTICEEAQDDRLAGYDGHIWLRIVNKPNSPPRFWDYTIYTQPEYEALSAEEKKGVMRLRMRHQFYFQLFDKSVKLTPVKDGETQQENKENDDTIDDFVAKATGEEDPDESHEDTLDSVMKRKMSQQLLKYAVGRQIACPFTGKILDVKDAVLVMTDGSSAVVCGDIYDKAKDHLAKSGKKYEIYDGRILFGKKSKSSKKIKESIDIASLFEIDLDAASKIAEIITQEHDITEDIRSAMHETSFDEDQSALKDIFSRAEKELNKVAKKYGFTLRLIDDKNKTLYFFPVVDNDLLEKESVDLASLFEADAVSKIAGIIYVQSAMHEIKSIINAETVHVGKDGDEVRYWIAEGKNGMSVIYDVLTSSFVAGDKDTYLKLIEASYKPAPKPASPAAAPTSAPGQSITVPEGGISSLSGGDVPAGDYTVKAASKNTVLLTSTDGKKTFVVEKSITDKILAGRKVSPPKKKGIMSRIFGEARDVVAPKIDETYANVKMKTKGTNLYLTPTKEFFDNVKDFDEDHMGGNEPGRQWKVFRHAILVDAIEGGDWELDFENGQMVLTYSDGTSFVHDRYALDDPYEELRDSKKLVLLCVGKNEDPTNESKDKGTNRFTNYYHCEDCDEDWQDDSESTNNDRCPSCNKEIEPYESHDIEDVNEAQRGFTKGQGPFLKTRWTEKLTDPHVVIDLHDEHGRAVPLDGAWQKRDSDGKFYENDSTSKRYKNISEFKQDVLAKAKDGHYGDTVKVSAEMIKSSTVTNENVDDQKNDLGKLLNIFKSSLLHFFENVESPDMSAGDALKNYAGFLADELDEKSDDVYKSLAKIVSEKVGESWDRMTCNEIVDSIKGKADADLANESKRSKPYDIPTHVTSKSHVAAIIDEFFDDMDRYGMRVMNRNPGGYVIAISDIEEFRTFLKHAKRVPGVDFVKVKDAKQVMEKKGKVDKAPYFVNADDEDYDGPDENGGVVYIDDNMLHSLGGEVTQHGRLDQYKVDDSDDKIKVGSEVVYSREFLKNTGQNTGKIPAAVGTVTDIKEMGKTSKINIATVDWGDDDIPDKINVKNLVLKSRKHLEPV